MKVISISGYAESGKDTVGKLFQEIAKKNGRKVMIIHFADVLKYSCAQYFGWNGEKDERGRTLLQQVGTELRLKNNPRLWEKITEELIKGFGPEFDYVLVPDTRFRDEIKMLKEKFNASTLLICRYSQVGEGESEDYQPYENSLTPEQRKHKSETDLNGYNFDFVICNTDYISFDSMDMLRLKVEDFFHTMEKESNHGSF